MAGATPLHLQGRGVGSLLRASEPLMVPAKVPSFSSRSAGVLAHAQMSHFLGWLRAPAWHRFTLSLSQQSQRCLVPLQIVGRQPMGSFWL